jgi:homogentisate 1,2-dioxygenase
MAAEAKTQSPPLAEDPYQYQSGFGNHFSTEAVPGSLPVGQNSPQVCAHGLYAEQLSGTAFTVPRDRNQRTWLYRIRPSVCHEAYAPHTAATAAAGATAAQFVRNFEALTPDPAQYRWMPRAVPSEPHTFVEGLRAVCGAGSPTTRSGMAIYTYTANQAMEKEGFYSSDGDWLLVPQQGVMDLQTEMGWMRVSPGEIAVVQRGIVFSVHPVGEEGLRGYVCEMYAGHFRLPDLGPIGANGLANPRDFQTPVAAYEERACDFAVLSKFQGVLFTARKDHSPYNVVAWHGNYAPYKYDLALFNTMNTVSYDHADPSIFTVLTCPTNTPGVAALDFVIFPSRWSVAEHTFRPPYFHRNCMSEYMGLIRGVYDAKEGGGFVPGGSSLHNYMTPHGPDATTFPKASTAGLKPEKLPDTLAFMFETSYMLSITEHGRTEHVDEHYLDCWKGHTSLFTAPKTQ